MKRFKIFMLGISVLILLAIVMYANPVVLVNLIIKSNYSLIVIGFGVAFLTMLLGALKWKVLLDGIGFLEVFPVQMLGYTISNFTPGKAGEPAKAVLLKISKGIPISSSLTSIIWERMSDVFSLLILSAIAISNLSVTSNFFFAGVASMVVFGGLIAVSFLVLYSKRFGMKIFRLVKKLPLLKRLPENFMDLFYKVRIKKVRIVKCFTIALITWFLEGFILYFALSAFGVSLNPLVLAGIVALSVVIGIASSLPGGLGTTEVVMTFLLGLNGVESSIAIAATIMFRFMTIWFVNLLGGVSFLYLSKKFDIKNIF
ncbi:MAG: lysylphosphatidylglycerol synthase transmembrane domain-containing protein [Candidatus Aenigmatarchaeota archaeon]